MRKERHMLKEFGFVIKIEHPHKFVLNYLQILDQDKQTVDAESAEFANDRYAVYDHMRSVQRRNDYVRHYIFSS